MKFSKLTVLRTNKGELFLSTKLNQMVANTKYHLDLFIHKWGFLCSDGDELSIYRLIDLARIESTKYKDHLLFDKVEQEVGQVIGERKDPLIQVGPYRFNSIGDLIVRPAEIDLEDTRQLAEILEREGEPIKASRLWQVIRAES